MQTSVLNISAVVLSGLHQEVYIGPTGNFEVNPLFVLILLSTPNEVWRIQRLKCCDNSNKDEDNSLHVSSVNIIE